MHGQSRALSSVVKAGLWNKSQFRGHDKTPNIAEANIPPAWGETPLMVGVSNSS
jgi:hypothetical protein